MNDKKLKILVVMPKQPNAVQRDHWKSLYEPLGYEVEFYIPSEEQSLEAWEETPSLPAIDETEEIDWESVYRSLWQYTHKYFSVSGRREHYPTPDE